MFTLNPCVVKPKYNLQQEDNRERKKENKTGDLFSANDDN